MPIICTILAQRRAKGALTLMTLQVCQVCAGQGRIRRLGRGMDVKISGWLAGQRAVKKTQGLDRVRRALLLQDGGGSGGDDGRLSKGDRLDKGVRGGGGGRREDGEHGSAMRTCVENAQT
ncbi:hypothetical protein NQZ68_040162 [Dissostichus eleginoides]|nr:hypothetical protein NQZ68_040162 [Dissostichus eleginoides]